MSEGIKNAGKATYLFTYNYHEDENCIIEANSFKDAVIQLAEYDGCKTPLFVKAMSGMDTDNEVMELFNRFSYRTVDKVYLIDSVVYSKDAEE